MPMHCLPGLGTQSFLLLSKQIVPGRYWARFFFPLLPSSSELLLLFVWCSFSWGPTRFCSCFRASKDDGICSIPVHSGQEAVGFATDVFMFAALPTLLEEQEDSKGSGSDGFFENHCSFKVTINVYWTLLWPRNRWQCHCENGGFGLLIEKKLQIGTSDIAISCIDVMKESWRFA